MGFKLNDGAPVIPLLGLLVADPEIGRPKPGNRALYDDAFEGEQRMGPIHAGRSLGRGGVHDHQGREGDDKGSSFHGHRPLGR